jgi:hypothetical protein
MFNALPEIQKPENFKGEKEFSKPEKEAIKGGHPWTEKEIRPEKPVQFGDLVVRLPDGIVVTLPQEVTKDIKLGQFRITREE